MEREFEHRLTEAVDRSLNNERRIDDLEKRQDNLEELTSTVKVLAVREERVENDVTEIKGDVKKLAGKSGKQWEKLVEAVITVVVGALVGFALAQMGL